MRIMEWRNFKKGGLEYGDFHLKHKRTRSLTLTRSHAMITGLSIENQSDLGILS